MMNVSRLARWVWRAWRSSQREISAGAEYSAKEAGRSRPAVVEETTPGRG
jgi:hypothetical protein